MDVLQKAAAFLLLIGLEKGRKVMDLMDRDELNAVLGEFSRLQELSPNMQESIWREFVQLGYEEGMNPAETLFVLRQLCHGGKLSDRTKKEYPFRKSL